MQLESIRTIRSPSESGRSECSVLAASSRQPGNRQAGRQLGWTVAESDSQPACRRQDAADTIHLAARLLSAE